MTGKIIQKALITISLLSTSFISLNAQGNNSSLFGIEGGMSSFRAQTNTAGYEIQKDSMAHFGLKLGAESEDFRVFVSARNYFAEKNNKMLTAGIEGQYKFNISKPVNFFIGLNGGTAYIEIAPDGVNPGVNITTPYVGGDLGFNFHASQLVDVELGAKYMFIDTLATQGVTTYDFRDLTSFYASLIFKWQMD
ncbi:MAG: outer membrane beta-barrel protein [Sulfurimonas sp.]|nr:outer membrane beta-barrel protein [Sulfurimonas sp.]